MVTFGNTNGLGPQQTHFAEESLLPIIPRKVTVGQVTLQQLGNEVFWPQRRHHGIHLTALLKGLENF